MSGSIHAGKPSIAKLAMLAAGLASALLTTSIASSAPLKKKPLSFSNVSIEASNTATSSALWVAQAQGYFKAHGLNVTYIPQAGSSTAIAILLSDSAQFDVTSTATDLPAAATGAPIRGLLMNALGSAQEIAITQAAASQFHIPSTGDTAKTALSQFEALKGSHLVVGISGVTSNSYAATLFLASRHGLTAGIGCASCDINMVSEGNTNNEIAAIEAGKVPAVAGAPPTTVISSPATIVIESWRIPPLAQAAANYLSTTTSMIHQHPDVVQAFVDAYVQGENWMQSHLQKAEQQVAAELANLGITSPEEQQYLFSGDEPFLVHLLPTPTTFNLAVQVINAIETPPITLKYSDYVDLRFVRTAEKDLHLKLG